MMIVVVVAGDGGIWMEKKASEMVMPMLNRIVYVIICIIMAIAFHFIQHSM